jgi:sugar/nucleoside kinase (ribokinase family)
MSIIIVGSVAFDMIETPFGKTGRILGGAGTYIALSTSNFNVEPQIISVVGSDFPQEYIDLFHKQNIVTQGLQIKTDEKTFFWSGVYHNDMNTRDSLITELNSLGSFDPIIPKAYQGTDYLMLGNLSPVIQRKVIERLHKRPKLIAMDTMNFWIETTPDELRKTIGMVDLLIVNDEEARQLSNEYSLVKAAEQILNTGIKYLIIKKGEHGALLFDKECIFSTPAFPLETVFDPTGAGDCFAGGFMGYIASTNDLSFDNMKRAVIFGSTIASFSVQEFGTKKLENLTKQEINERIRQFVNLTRFDFGMELK